MSWTHLVVLGWGLLATTALAGPTRPAFRYVAAAPRGFVTAVPTPDGSWKLGPRSVYAPYPDEIAHYATATPGVQVIVRAISPEPFATVRGDVAAWATSVTARATADLISTGPQDRVQDVTSSPPTVHEGTAGRSVTSAHRYQLGAGAIDIYACVAERAGMLYVVSIVVVGARKVPDVRRWLRAFVDAPFKLRPAWPIFPPVPPLAPPTTPRPNQ